MVSNPAIPGIGRTAIFGIGRTEDARNPNYERLNSYAELRRNYENEGEIGGGR